MPVVLPGAHPAGLSVREKAFVAAMCVSIAVMTSNYALMVAFFPVDMAARGMSKFFSPTFFGGAHLRAN